METLPNGVNLLVEGDLDEAVACRLLADVALPIGRVYGKQGKAYVLPNLPKYNQAARFGPWLALVDLDQDLECAPVLVRTALPDPAAGMRFRVAVHAVEAWLLADAERMASFLAIPRHRIPAQPDQLPDPKQTLVNLARRSARRSLREDLVPREGSGARVGPGYTGRLIEFVLQAVDPWRPGAAQERSPSLRSCLAALASLRRWRPG